MQDLLSEEYEDLGFSSLLEVLERLVPIEGLTLMDVGCGGGRLAKELAARGAKVTGVEPDPIQAEKNRQAEPVPGLTFVESGGENLPADDASIDGVFYRYSLHHVPGDLLEPAMLEAVRVLKPGGYLCVVEPLLAGSMQKVYAPFHDETKVRTRAYEALQHIVWPRFQKVREIRYGEWAEHDSFEAFRDRVLGLTYNDIDAARVDNPHVRAIFEAGKQPDGSYKFDRYARVNVFEGPTNRVAQT
jgi:ubiquinone/menaquinone biosynthesis C-methylase UbiE